MEENEREETEETAEPEAEEKPAEEKAAEAAESEAEEKAESGETAVTVQNVAAGRAEPEEEEKEEEEKKLVNETENDLAINVAVAKILSGKVKLVLLLCGALVMLAGLAFILIEALSPSADGMQEYISGGILVVFGAFFFALGASYGLLLKASCKKIMQDKSAVVTYTFGEDEYVALSKVTDGTTGETRGGYASFRQCKEYADGWLLYLNKANIFALKKAGMKEGSAEELANLLRKQLGSRYDARSASKVIFP